MPSAMRVWHGSKQDCGDHASDPIMSCMSARLLVVAGQIMNLTYFLALFLNVLLYSVVTNIFEELLKELILL